MKTIDREKIQKLRLDEELPVNPSSGERRRDGSIVRSAAMFLLGGAAVAIAFLLWPSPGNPPVSAKAGVATGAAEDVAVRPATSGAATQGAQGASAQGHPAGNFVAAGYVEPAPPFPVKVSPLVSGRLESLAVIEGGAVAKGDVIGELNTEAAERRAEELRAALAVNAARLDQRRRVLARQQNLAGIGSVSQAELEQAESEIAVGDAEKHRLRAQLDRVLWEIESSKVRAPVDGVIFERLAHPGDFVGPGGHAAIATIFDPARLQVRADVNQRDAWRVVKGQRAELRFDADPGNTYEGRVLRIQPKASLSKNTVEVKVSVTGPSAGIRPDLSARVTFFEK
ncbi:MAG: efflux RND transporter periplasmic adaptor subunit [Opitutales bacterium]|nr:efflux RND transporter periplasmic adaptor subunit [Opitutales bacterium]